jgi:hypothetical protein
MPKPSAKAAHYRWNLPTGPAGWVGYWIGFTMTAMEQLRLRPMTVAVFETYRAQLIPEYAAEHVRAGDWTADQAETMAARQIDDLLPEGPGTPGMLLLMAGTSDGEPVGLVWVALGRPRPDEAWIYDIKINPEHRGKAMVVPSSLLPSRRPPSTAARQSA